MWTGYNKKWVKENLDYQKVTNHSNTRNASNRFRERDLDGCDYDEEMCFRESYF